MNNAYDSLRQAAEEAIELLTGTPGQVERAVQALRKALDQVTWIDVTPQTMPQERIRVIASFGTCVIPDCFYGTASGFRSPQDELKLWRETNSERPLTFVPTSWMPMPKEPRPPESGRTSPVVEQSCTAPPQQGCCLLCREALHIPQGLEPTEVCNDCAQEATDRLLNSMGVGGGRVRALAGYLEAERYAEVTRLTPRDFDSRQMFAGSPEGFELSIHTLDRKYTLRAMLKDAMLRLSMEDADGDEFISTSHPFPANVQANDPGTALLRNFYSGHLLEKLRDAYTRQTMERR